MAPPQYTFLTTDLITNRVLGEIPVSGVTLDCQLNTPGNMSANANLDDPRISNSDFIACTIPGRTSFWAYRGGKIVWGGIIWSRQWTTQGKAFALTGQTFESYALRRFPYSWQGTNIVTYTNGQCFIINDLWAKLQGVKYGNIGVMPAQPTPSLLDVQRIVEVDGFDLSTSVDDIIQSLVAFNNGPDYTITWPTDANGLPLKQLVLGVQLGNPISQTDLSLDFPGGTVQNYVFLENAAAGNNLWYATGSGSDASQVVGTATDLTTLTAGYPLLEGVDTANTDVSDVPTLQAYAAADLTALPVPYKTLSATLNGTKFPMFGTYNLGDYVNMHMVDGRFPQGVTHHRRVTGWTITPPDSANGVEQVTLVLSDELVPDVYGLQGG
jgi:hypothetical protein